MNTISLDEIRETLAQEDAENIYEYKDLYDVFMNGCQGYVNFTDDDCITWYLDRGHVYDSALEDEEAVEVAHVVDSNGTLRYVLTQYCGEVSSIKV